MSDKKKTPGQQPKTLSDEAAVRMKAQIDYNVGYRKPPKETQFQKDRSGNPRGRPRAAKADGLRLEEQPLLRAMYERAQKPVRMREGNTVSEVSAREALIQSVLAAALKGNARSQGLALDMMRAADIQRARDRAERQALAASFKAAKAEELARAIEAGEDTRLVLPHPDDIVIDDDYGFDIIGPCDESELRKVEDTVRYRDALIMQDVLDERRADRRPGDRSSRSYEAGQSGALLFAVALNKCLPQRYRVDDTTIAFRMMRYEGINLRQLLKNTYRAWRAAGVPARRGAHFADLSTSARTVEFQAALHRAHHDGRINLDAMARGEFDDAALELMEAHGFSAPG